MLLTVCNQTLKLIVSKRRSEEIVESVCEAARAFSEDFFLNQISFGEAFVVFLQLMTLDIGDDRPTAL